MANEHESSNDARNWTIGLCTLLRSSKRFHTGAQSEAERRRSGSLAVAMIEERSLGLRGCIIYDCRLKVVLQAVPKHQIQAISK